MLFYPQKESFMSEKWADRSLRLYVLDLDLKLSYIISSTYCHNLGRSEDTRKGELEEKKCRDECQVPLFTLLLLVLELKSSFKNLMLVRWLNVCEMNNSKGKYFPGGSDGKASACNVGDPGSIPGLGRSPGEGNGNPPQHFCLENPMDGRAWWATVHGVTKSQTRLSDFTSRENNGRRVLIRASFSHNTSVSHWHFPGISPCVENRYLDNRGGIVMKREKQNALIMSPVLCVYIIYFI